jgi:polyphosphate kinase
MVRGMCVVRPGVPGVSTTIRVRSIVGRFLEHSRICAFENGGDRELYIGSADWMGRNLDRRVETMVPVLDPLQAETIYGQILAIAFADNVKARELQTDGTYRRLRPQGEMPIDSQHIFLTQSQSV